jgi:hypothetical protein
MHEIHPDEMVTNMLDLKRVGPLADENVDGL